MTKRRANYETGRKRVKNYFCRKNISCDAKILCVTFYSSGLFCSSLGIWQGLTSQMEKDVKNGLCLNFLLVLVSRMFIAWS